MHIRTCVEPRRGGGREGARGSQRSGEHSGVPASGVLLAQKEKKNHSCNGICLSRCCIMCKFQSCIFHPVELPGIINYLKYFRRLLLLALCFQPPAQKYGFNCLLPLSHVSQGTKRKYQSAGCGCCQQPKGVTICDITKGLFLQNTHFLSKKSNSKEARDGLFFYTFLINVYVP